VLLPLGGCQTAALPLPAQRPLAQRRCPLLATVLWVLPWKPMAPLALHVLLLLVLVVVVMMMLVVIMVVVLLLSSVGGHAASLLQAPVLQVAPVLLLLPPLLAMWHHLMQSASPSGDSERQQHVWGALHVQVPPVLLCKQAPEHLQQTQRTLGWEGAMRTACPCQRRTFCRLQLT
jgi:hypothetical protein